MRGLLLSCVLAGCGLTLDLTPPVSDAGRGSDAGFRDAGLDAIPPDAPSCERHEDCEGLVRMEPPTSCGDYRCDRGFCLANDIDGDGVGPGCADERDCDDLNPDIGINAIVACPTPGICGESATLSCVDGMWDDACEGEQPPQTELCNGLDDDCNGTPDDGVLPRIEGAGACERRYECVAGAWVGSEPDPVAEVCGDMVDDDCDGTTDDPECVEACTYVALDSDGVPVGTLNSLDAAVLRPDARVICLVALVDESGACLGTNFPLGVDLQPNTTIIGGFRPDDGSVGRCARDHLTRIESPAGGRATVHATGNAQLIDLAVQYARGADSVAIEADGTLVTSNVLVMPPNSGSPPGQSTGIQVNRGAQLLAVDTDIEAFGLDSTGIDAEGDVSLLNGCTSTPCACERDGTGITGRGEAGRAVVVRDATLTAERYAICGEGTTALELDGAAAFVANSALETFSAATDAVFASCDADDAIWLHANQVHVHDANGGNSTGVALLGDCEALLSSNSIHGLSSGSTATSIGVYSDGVDCSLAQNTIIGLDASGSAQDAFGLVCRSESGPGNCRFVTDNVILGAAGTVGGSLNPYSTTGVEIVHSNFAFIEGNQITGGCAENDVVGMYVDDSTFVGRANRVVGLDCGRAAMGSHIGLEVLESVLTWSGNTVHGGAVPMGGDCNSIGALIDGRAILRNNLFMGGESCGFNLAAEVQGPTLLMAYNGFTLGEPLLILAGDPYRDATMLQGTYPLFVGHVFDDAIGARNFASYPDNLHLTSASPFYRAGSVPAGRTEDGIAHGPMPSIGAYEL